MRRVTLALMSTIAALVLLFSYRTSTGALRGDHTAATGGEAPGIVSNTAPQSAPSSPAAGADPGDDTESGGSESTSNADVVVNGTVAQTAEGPVQVRVTISGGRISDVDTLRYPGGNARHEQINGRALPILRQQALDAQSAQIDGVSGATATSEGYAESLQAALDTADFQ